MNCDYDAQAQHGLGARYYSSQLGRFLTPDWSEDPEPIPYADLSDPQSLNLYSYVENNPVTATDPDGHCCSWSDVSSSFVNEWHDVTEMFNAVAGVAFDPAPPQLPSAPAPPAANAGCNASPCSVNVYASEPNTSLLIDKNKVIEYMDSHANGIGNYGGNCAAACRHGLEAGGLDTNGRPQDAKDYGPFLTKRGAFIVSPEGYKPQMGDIAVFQGGGRDKNGHIEIYDGKQWVSDTKQPGFLPRHDYPGKNSIYRFPNS